MERVSRFLEETPTSSLRGVHRGVTGKNETLTLALNSLLAEGYVRCDTGGRGGQQWSSVEPFRAPDDELAHLTHPVDNPEEGDRVPPRPHCRMAGC